VSKFPLNPGQEAAAEGIFVYLMNTHQREMCISGPGGVGKTKLMGAVIDETIPRYYQMCELMNLPRIYEEVNMTATTNKAAEELGRSTDRPTQTLHSLLKLRVYNDYQTGKTKVTRGRDWAPLVRKVIFVDEASMMDSLLRKYLLDSAVNCKIIYVGDHCQLPPVGEDISPIYKDHLPFFELTQPMRNAEQPALMFVCQQLRETVLSGISSDQPRFHPVQVVPGVIDHMSQGEMTAEVARLFKDPSVRDRILCYTNKKVNRLNEYIRTVLRGMPPELVVGEFVVNNAAVINKKMTLRVEEEFEVVTLGPVVKHVIPGTAESVMVHNVTLSGQHGVFEDVPVPVDRDEVVRLFKKFTADRDWTSKFYMSETFPDLRPRDACTVYKAQGSTYDTTFIDLSDISNCWDANVAARMLYVAFSRAKNRIVLFGDLKSKYGGLVR
jgi:exodeoxyribonuclease-5